MPLKITNIIEKEKPTHFRDKTWKLSIRKSDVELRFCRFQVSPRITSFHKSTNVNVRS